MSFVLIKSKNNIKGLDIHGYNFLCTTYTQDSFFFKNKKSVIEAIKILDEFSFFSGLKPNKEKCEDAGIGVKKGVQVALCGMKNIDLRKKSESSRSSISLQQITWKWKQLQNSTQKIEENLTLEGKITIFKTLAISIIRHLASVTVLPYSTITRSNKIYKECIGTQKRPKVKEKTLITIFDKGGLKDVYILSEITTLQCSWVKKLFYTNLHEWKIIPHFLKSIEKYTEIPKSILEKKSFMVPFSWHSPVPY